MAIKISGTEVIDINRTLQNITGANGTYGNFHASAASISTALNFSTPMMTKILSANTTFSESNKAAGKSAMLLLDTSSNFHTPTFSSDIKWESGTTPTWSGYRYWQIGLLCIDSTTVRGIAKGYESTSSSPSETITLSGTSGTPILVFLSSPVWTGTQWLVENGLFFDTDGVLYETSRSFNASQQNIPHASGEWCNVTPSQTYYLRVTDNSGDVLPNSYSDSLNTWHSLATGRYFVYEDNSTYGSYGARNMQLKVEIASDSGGSNILDTGYYQIYWEGGA